MKHPDLVTAAAALRDQTAHVTQRLDGRIIVALGVGGAELPCPRAGCDHRQKQANDHDCGPPNAGVAVHWHFIPPVMMSMVGKKGSTQASRRLPRSQYGHGDRKSGGLVSGAPP